MGNDRRTGETGRRKEEREMKSLFCPQLKGNIARIQSNTKASEGCDGGMKEKKYPEQRWVEVLGCEEEQSGPN